MGVSRHQGPKIDPKMTGVLIEQKTQTGPCNIDPEVVRLLLKGTHKQDMFMVTAM